MDNSPSRFVMDLKLSLRYGGNGHSVESQINEVFPDDFDEALAGAIDRLKFALSEVSRWKEEQVTS